MFNKQLRVNIAALDLQISQLGKEIEQHKKDSKYEIKMEKLEALTEIRVKIAKSVGPDVTNDAVVELDKQIEDLTKVIANLERDEAYAAMLKKFEDLTNVRVQLSECKIKESHAAQIISGVLGIGAMLLVLNYEKADIITSKAFGMIPNLFKRV